ncbi:MAG: MBL fold metallo-hydrolase [Rhizobiaceae bacterium]|nr:MBL fold metallo-hydrolase [Rhizobiaceae bacterium]
MIGFQESAKPVSEEIKLAYFGGSAFRITAPSGLTVMIDPWRNPPWGTWNWYLYDFPEVEVDIGISTHAHFDHDNLHSLHASTLLDRLIGRYEFADVAIIGIADKHVSDCSHADVDWSGLTRKLTPMETRPPNNWRSFDNTIIVIEVGGLRILHWGDNRPNVSDDIWKRIGEIDIALLPIDGSQHVLGYEQAADIRQKLSAKVVVPHHYFIWNVTHRASTLGPPDEWMGLQSNTKWAETGEVSLSADWVRKQKDLSFCFGENVAFELPDLAGDKERADRA